MVHLGIGVGWGVCNARVNLLAKAETLNKLSVANYIKGVVKYYCGYTGSSISHNRTSVTDKLWSLHDKEIFAVKSGYSEGTIYGPQYCYYRLIVGTSADIYAKNLDNGMIFWLRGCDGDSRPTCLHSGSLSHDDPNVGHDVIPCFCI